STTASPTSPATSRCCTATACTSSRSSSAWAISRRAHLSTGRASMRHAQGYAATAATILLTVYGQLIVKWQVEHAGKFPTATSERISYLVRLTFNPWVLTAFLAALLAALAWFIVL